MQNSNKDRFPKMLLLVVIFLSILLFIPSITMHRIIKFGSVEVSLAVFFFSFVYSILDAITEVYKKKAAIFIFSSCYLISLFFSIILMVAMKFPSPSGLGNQDAYYIVFHQGPWIILVGILSVGLSMYVNINLMSKWRVKLRGRHFMIRSIVISSLGELIVTGIGYPLIWMRIDKSILILMISAFVVKILYAIVAAIPARIIVFLLRVVDGRTEEHYNNEFMLAYKVLK